MNSVTTLYYVHDPMCSWCWAFRPSLNALLAELPEQIDVIRLLGGLAVDSDEPMPDATKAYVQRNWQAIEQRVPETKFNYDFWEYCQPRRSTYPACRAVIAARAQGKEFDKKMTLAIQQAYYLQARNPSDVSVLTELAIEVGLDKDKFNAGLLSAETDEILQKEINLSRQLGLNSFPGLLLDTGDKQIRIDPEYLNADIMLKKMLPCF
ncbi:MAG TPA: DsbA family protein [Thiotrichaceae bacterium]|nr:DsbA family protein [Thiotrichaceae bacterium]HIM07552.1 DsbA family protein [Gammaproteobacteria bacterium]